MKRTAMVSTCGRYRFALGRAWDDQLPRLVFVMLNPSTADAEQDDPTIRKCIGFAKRWGFGGIHVVNLFAWRSTDPSGLADAPDPVGPVNDEIIRQITSDPAASVIVAWGANGRRYPERIAHVVRLMHRAVRCISKTGTGQPGHPLMLPYNRMPQPWDLAARPEPRDETKEGA